VKPLSNYLPFIRDNFTIIDKEGEEVPFEPNQVQSRYAQEATGHDIILKARQQGFSSLILAIFTTDFILKENARCVVVADIEENAQELLDRVKHYIRSYEQINKTKVPLKYNSKSQNYTTTLLTVDTQSVQLKLQSSVDPRQSLIFICQKQHFIPISPRYSKVLVMP
jgi:hypothetical protein